MGLDIHLFVNPTATLDAEHKTRNPLPDVNNVAIGHWRNRWELYNVLETMYKDYDPEHLSMDQASYKDDISYCLLLDQEDVKRITTKINELYITRNIIEIDGIEYTNYLSESEETLNHDLYIMRIAWLNLFIEDNNILFASWSY